MKVAPLLAALACLPAFASRPAAAAAATVAAPAERGGTPNEVVILADDLGYGSVGCYGADPALVRTPNIDRLAREGRRFTDASTPSAVCSPTRYAVVTGRYCWRTPAKYGVLSTFSPLHVEPGRLTIASLLKRQGYRTAAVGKWHLGYGAGDGTPRWRADYTAELTPGPLDVGFDYHFGVPGNHGDVTGVYVQDRFVYGLRSGKIPPGLRLPGPAAGDVNFQPTYTPQDTESGKAAPIDVDAPRRKNDRVMPLLTDRAVGWIEQQKAGTPFFLYFAPVAVHNPVTPEKDLAGTSAAGPFGDWIHQLDRSVGRVLDALDRQGLARDTLVVLTSDNGGVRVPSKPDLPQTRAVAAGLAVNGPWRGGKHSAFEGGVRVPFIVRWPGRAPAGTTCDDMVNVTDLLATAAAVVGAPLPPPGRAAEDSHNILPAILGERPAAPVRPDMIVQNTDGVSAIRRGPWKWIEGVRAAPAKDGVRARSAEARPQLYNLADDPGETTDVARAHPGVVEELRALLVRYRDGGYSRELPPAPDNPSAGGAGPERDGPPVRR